ncbi:MAG TPA: MFS transporter [Parvibaculum sp.]|jgi:DHA2 family multidrug resistance protein
MPERRDLVLLLGLTLAATADAVAGTALSLTRSSMAGIIHATPDEYAWLDMGFTAAKMLAFLTVPALAGRIDVHKILVWSLALAIGAAAICAASGSLHVILIARLIEGLAGGALLVSGQAIAFLHYPRRHQPIVQAVFALGAVMAPTTFAPALEGWIVDALTWRWVFIATLGIGLLALAMILAARVAVPMRMARTRVNAARFICLGVVLTALTYVLTLGERWNWLASPEIAFAGAVLLGALAVYILLQRRVAMIEISPFRHADFTFGFIVSFVAGIALSGSAYLIPAFTTSVLGFSPKAAGFLLLPSGGLIAVGLIGAGCAILFARVQPFKLVPPGLLFFIVAIWMLSYTSGSSGTADMMLPLLLRGLGLGFLFVALTLITLLELDDSEVLAGIGLFDFGKQMGGLLGGAGLQTLVGHKIALADTILSAHVTAESPALAARMAGVASSLAARGLDPAAAAQAAYGVIARQLQQQCALIAYGDTFALYALFFVAAAPCIVTIKILLTRFATRGRQDAAVHPAA